MEDFKQEGKMSKSQRKNKGDFSGTDESRVPAEKQQSPIKIATRLLISEEPKSKSRRRKSEPGERKERVLSEAELREEAAWRQVEETGKPVQFEDTLLIPEGMSFWEAVEFLPEGIREQTSSAMEEKIAEVHFDLVRRRRDQILEKAVEDSKWEQYKTFPYAAQMAIADSIVRQQLGMPEIPIPELIKLHGGKIKDTPEDDQAE
jgi:hypothetical protein